MNIPKELLEEAVRLSGASTQTTAVIMGLEELVRRKKRERLAALRGSGALRLTRPQQAKLRER